MPEESHKQSMNQSQKEISPDFGPGSEGSNAISKLMDKLAESRGENWYNIDKSAVGTEDIGQLIRTGPVVVYTREFSEICPFTFISENLHNLLGYSSDEFISDSEFWLNHLHPTDRLHVTADLKRLSDAKTLVLEYRIKSRSDDYIWIRDELKLVSNPGQGDSLVIGGMVDITAQKTSENKLIRRNRLLDAARIVFEEALRCETEEEVARICLNVAVEMTESRLGWIGLLDITSRLDIICVNHSSSNPEELPEPDPELPMTIEGKSLKSIWGRIIKDKEIIKLHDGGVDPEDFDIQSRKLALSGFIGVPLSRDGKNYGMIALANADGKYSAETLSDLEAFTGYIINALTSRKSGRKPVEAPAVYSAAVLDAAEEPKTDSVSLIQPTNHGEFDYSFFSKLIEKLPFSYFICGLDGSIKFVSQRLKDLTGLRADEKDVDTITRLFNDESSTEINRVIQALKDEGSFIDRKVELKNIEGKSIPVSLSLTELEIDGKGNKKIFGEVREIPAPSQIDEDSHSELNKLREENQELEHILYVASHDLRSPLVNVKGFSQELKLSMVELKNLFSGVDLPQAVRKHFDEILQSDINEALGFIEASSDKMDNLLNGLLQLSRLGRIELKIEDVNVKELISNLLKTFEFQIKESGTEVTIGNLPACRADEQQLNQVFSNLVDNAIKFLDSDRKGRISIAGRIEGDFSIYTVEDNGIGIAEEHREKAFEMFQRLHTSNRPGEGLGLALARRILEKQSGSIDIEAGAKQGSRFIVKLPKSDSGRQAASQHELVFILAEYDQGNAALIRKNLRRAGFLNDIIHFTNGRETLEYILQKRDLLRMDGGTGLLLLLDIRMPEVGGIEILKTLKEDADFQNIPVIMLSSTGDPRDIEPCRKLGCENIITKSTLYEKLIEEIRKVGLFFKVVQAPLNSGDKYNGENGSD